MTIKKVKMKRQTKKMYPKTHPRIKMKQKQKKTSYSGAVKTNATEEKLQKDFWDSAEETSDLVI